MSTEWVTSIEDFVDEDDPKVISVSSVSYSQYRIESLRGIELFQHLICLNLNHNSIEDISPLKACGKTLQVIHLSDNLISSLGDRAFWTQFTELKALNLNSNHIISWKVLLSLDSIPKLITLSIRDNPVAEYSNLRQFLVNHIPKLRVLDNFIISDEERIQKAVFGKRYGALSAHLEVEVVPEQHDSKSLSIYFTNIRKLHEKFSPVIQMQKVIRGWLSRRIVQNNLSLYKVAIIVIQSRFRGILFRNRLRYDLRCMLSELGQEHLMRTSVERALHMHASNIQRWWKEIDLSTTNIRAAKRVQAWFRTKCFRLEETRKVYNTLHCSYILFLERDMEHVIASAIDALRIDDVLRGLSNEDANEFVRSRIFESGYTVLKPFTYLRYENCAEIKSFESDGIIRQFGSRKDIALRCLHRQIELVKSDLQAVMRDSDCEFKPKTEIIKLNLKRHLEALKQRELFMRRNRSYKRKSPTDMPPNNNPFKRRGFQPSAKELSYTGEDQDTYSQLWIYFPGNANVLSRTLHLIGRFADPFSRPLAYFELQVMRINSITLIQSIWRAYNTRRTISTLIYTRVVKKRAVTCIQRAWRYYSGIGRRMRFIFKMLEVLTMTTSRTIYLEAHLYRTLLNPTRFTALNLQNTYCSNMHSRVHFDDNGEVYLVDQLSESRSRNLPKWLPFHPTLGFIRLQSPNNVHTIIKQLLSVGVEISSVIDTESLTDDVLYSSIDHENLQTYSPYSSRADGFHTLMEYIERLWDSPMTWGDTCPLVRLTFSSINEARRRALLLFCLSWTSKNDHFIKAFSFLELHSLWGKRMGKINIPCMIVCDIPTPLGQPCLPTKRSVNEGSSIQIHGPSYIVINSDHVSEQKLENANYIREMSRRLAETKLQNNVLTKVQKIEKIHAKRQPIRPASPFAGNANNRSNNQEFRVHENNRHASMLKKMQMEDKLRKDQTTRLYQERTKAKHTLKLEKEIVQTERLALTVEDKNELKGKLDRVRIARNTDLLDKRYRIDTTRDTSEKKKKEREFAVAFGNQTVILSRHSTFGKNQAKKMNARSAFLATVQDRKTQAAKDKKNRDMLAEQQVINKQMQVMTQKYDMRQELYRVEKRKEEKLEEIHRRKDYAWAVKELLSGSRHHKEPFRPKKTGNRNAFNRSKTKTKENDQLLSAWNTLL